MLDADLLALSWDEGIGTAVSVLPVSPVLRQLLHRHSAREGPQERCMLSL